MKPSHWRFHLILTKGDIMEIMTYTSDQLTNLDIDNITNVASKGFERAVDKAMRDDTERHIGAADQIQLASDNKELVGFAFYRSCLWRACN